MNTIRHIIVIPVYNDWKSLNKLLIQINKNFKNDVNFETEILIINDCSTENIQIDNKNLTAIKEITVITLKKNFGSQKSIAIGLSHLKTKNYKSLITIMDGDGEDNPHQIKDMMHEAINNQNLIITSNRKRRQESFFIRTLYNLHLILTYIFTFKWISFGNFSTFDSDNLDKILSNNSAWYAHSSAILNNCKIKRLYAKREKRYFDKSKLNLLALVEHSLRVNVVFLNKIFINSLFYTVLIFYFTAPSHLSFFFILMIIIFNIFLLFIKKKHYIKNLVNLNNLIDNIKLF